MNDGEHYTVIEGKNKDLGIFKYSYSDDSFHQPIVLTKNLVCNNDQINIDDYNFSNDETKILIASDQSPIYRYSSKSQYYIYDLKSKITTKLTQGDKQMYATFSPEDNKIAFVKNNNLYYTDLTDKKETQITFDGKTNEILNGLSDWVYEEELELVKAFEWSPDGSKIAYFKFDESNVKEWMMKIYGDLYPEEERFKYPKAGEENSKVAVYIYDLITGKTIKTELPEGYEYISRINWTNDSKKLAIQTLNRHQNILDINLADATSGKSKVIYHEEDANYVEVPTTKFLTTKNQFLITSEKDGFNHIYLYDIEGKLINQITKGNWDVTDFYGIDEKKGLIYYQSAEISPMDRQIFSVKINGSSKKQLTQKSGQNEAEFSSTFKYFINNFSNANTPYYISINDNNGKELRVLEDNNPLIKKMEKINITPKQFFKIKVNNTTLNAWKILPGNFDANKKYPVLMYVYGGPGINTVNDSWEGSNYFWFEMLAEKGYIIVSVDNRGTGQRGAKFKKLTYKQLGKYETEDQIASAKYLASLPYVDGSRIGIFGWSYGGYMSSLCITKGANIFKTAIAVAPVTNWRYYDNIYTERYMQTPQENPDGYDKNSPINFVDKLKGNFLLIHGMADDNVHYQNSVEMSAALINANKQFTEMSYPNKNHGIYGGNTRLHLYTLMTNFLLNNL